MPMSFSLFPCSLSLYIYMHSPPSSLVSPFFSLYRFSSLAVDQRWTPVCSHSQPIWKEFANPLKCMFSTTFILFSYVFSFSWWSPVKTQPRLRLPRKTLAFLRADTVKDKKFGSLQALSSWKRQTLSLSFLGTALPATMIPLCCNVLKWDLEVFLFLFTLTKCSYAVEFV